MKITLRVADGTGLSCEIPPLGARFVRVAGVCPACKDEPFLAAGRAETRRHDFDTYYSTAECVRCKAEVGTLEVKVETIFGIEEDQAISQRARVYR